MEKGVQLIQFQRILKYFINRNCISFILFPHSGGPFFFTSFHFPPQCSFSMNSNVHTGSTLPLLPHSHLASVILQSKVLLSCESNTANLVVVYHRTRCLSLACVTNALITKRCVKLFLMQPLNLFEHLLELLLFLPLQKASKVFWFSKP